VKFFGKPKKWDDVTTLDETDLICYCIEVDKETITNAIKNGAIMLKTIKEQTKACTGSDCKNVNPNRRCCSKEIKQLIALNY